MHKVYVFGNEDLETDSAALLFTKSQEGKEFEYCYVKPNQDLPFDDGTDVVIIDVVEGIDEIKVFEIKAGNNSALPNRGTAHDFDLNFQLNYLRKLGKLGKITVVGLPMKTKFDYKYVQSILRKLVAQDMQGS